MPHPLSDNSGIVSVQPALLPQPGERLLVVSPHPDDESLGTGGLICEAVRRGADVQIVYLTSGDGFPLAAAVHFRHWPSREVLHRLAAVRREEALRALGHLGVGETSVYFLDFPDRELASLWLSEGETPHLSRKVAAGRRSGTADRAVSRASLLARLECILDEVAPDHLYFPDPADDHPDHWAAYCFLRLLLESRRLRGVPEPRTWRTYLIHRGCWPRPLQERPDLGLAPPPELTGLGVRWEHLPLATEVLAAKRRALHEHHTQQRLVGNFFRGFVRRAELFSDWETTHSHNAGDANALRLRDPVADRFGRARCGAADVEAFEVSTGDAGPILHVHLRAPALRGLNYRVFWTPVTLDPTEAVVRSSGFGTGSPRNDPAPAGRGKREFRLHLPPEFNTTPLLIGAEVWLGAVLFERTPWRFVPSYQSPPKVTC